MKISWSISHSANILIVIQFLLITSCVTSYQPELYNYKSNININLSKNNLSYQIAADNIFEKPLYKQLDTFDNIFLSQFYNKIKSKGYIISQDSLVQTMHLENCLIDVSYGEPKLIRYTMDSFYVNQIATTLVCQTNITQNQLFTATYDTYQEFEIEPKRNAKNSLDSSKSWQETTNYYYYVKPISYNQGYLIARNLSEKACHKLDSINMAVFKIRHAELTTKSDLVKPQINLKLSRFVNVLTIITITLLTVAINL